MKIISIILFFGLFLINCGKKLENKKEKKENGKKSALMPSFDRSSENLTVIIGNSAVLPCFITNLGDHKVAWIKVANMDILTIGDYKVTNDDRIQLAQGYVSDWSLTIHPITEEDAGEYICQVNTEPQIISKIYLQVQLPPKIIEEKSTINPGPIIEGSTLKLHCHSEGIPYPHVLWYFRKPKLKTEKFLFQNHKSDQVIHEGDTLVIKNVSRHHSGLYECIANNSVPPAASRKIKVSVEFGPEMHVTNEKIEHSVGHDVRLECKIRSNPLINHYWMKDDRVIENVDNNKKYDTFIHNHNDFLTISVLLIKNLSSYDFGKYECYAVNSLNTSKIEIYLKEIVRKTSTIKSTVSRIIVYNDKPRMTIPTTKPHTKLHRKNTNSSKYIKNMKLSDDEYSDDMSRYDSFFNCAKSKSKLNSHLFNYFIIMIFFLNYL